MTLVLAPPGHGKSSLLKAIAQRLPGDTCASVRYNGRTAAEARAAGVYVEREVAYAPQSDEHFAELTVQETLDFAAATLRPLPPAGDATAAALHNEEVSQIMRMLRLEECANTVVGNDGLRGISGGQRKRVTIAEALLSNARVLCLDEVTTGLDAAVAFDIMRNLREWTRITNGTIVAALLQPTPEIFELFDDVIILRNGAEIFHGGRNEVAAYFGSLGWIPPTPAEGDLADWLQELCGNPKKLAHKQVRHVQRLLQHMPDAVSRALAAKGTPTIAAGAEVVAVPEIAVQTQDAPVSAASVTGIVEGGAESPSDTESSDDGGEEGGGVGLDGAVTAGADSGVVRASSQVATPSADELLLSNPFFHAPAEPRAVHGTALEAAWRDHLGSAKSTKPAVVAPSAHELAAYGSAYARSVWMLTWLIMARQTRLVLRNKLLLYSLPIAGGITAAISGSLFYKLRPDDFASKLGCIFYTLVHLGFQGNAEVASIIAVRPIIYRQSAARMYPASLYPTAHIIWAIPRAIVEVSVFVCVLYFLVGFSHTAANFFMFWFLILVGALSMSAWLRLVAFIAPTFELAGALGMPIASMQCIFGGFLLTREQVPKWLLGGYWASPFSWMFRALVRTESNDASYQVRPIPNGPTLGDLYMQSFEMQTEQYWVGAGIGFAIGFYLLGIILTGVAITYIQHSSAQGTSRENASDDHPPHAISSSHPHGPSKASASAPRRSSAANSDLSAIVPVFSQSNALPFQPASLVFRGVHYVVTLTKQMGGGQRTLLRGVSGYALPGRVTLLMGASGAGKTTLLDAIAGRKNTGVLTGEVFVNGQPKTASFARISAYVEQSDVHSPFVTVREALEFSAVMRLPPSVTEEARKAFIAEIVSVLELEDVLDRLIGEPSRGGLSASQLKRLSIGVELCSNAAILFLDEPTSGLDASQAAVVMRVIHNLAKTLNRTVVTTIHQPSTEIFLMGDTLLLLQTGGYEVYCGPLGRHGRRVTKHIANVHPALPACPPDTNPATYMLEMLGRYPQQIQDTSVVPVKAGGEAAPAAAGLAFGTPLDWQGVYRASDAYKLALEAVNGAIKSGGGGGASTKATSDADMEAALQRPWLVTFRHVLRRTWTIYDRNMGYTFGRVVTFIFLALVFGILYYDIGNAPPSYGAVRSKISVIFLSVAFGGTLFYTMPMPVLGRERALVYREKSGRLYHVLHYGAAVLLTELPWILAATGFHATIMYWMIGLKVDAGVFFHYLLVLFEIGVVFTSFGIWFAWLFPTPEIAQIWGGVLIALFFIFAGLLSPAPLIGPQWYWLYQADPVSYALEAVVGPQFHCAGGLAAGCPSLTVPSSSGFQTVVISDYIDSYFGIRYEDRWADVGWLALFAGVLTLLALLSLRFVSWIRR